MRRPKREVRTQRTKNGFIQVVAGGAVVASYRGADCARRATEHEARLRLAAAVLDDHIPLRGPCLICGVPGMDAAHRIEDAIAGQARAEWDGGDDDPTWVAEEYGYLPEHSAAITDACLVWTALRRDDPLCEGITNARAAANRQAFEPAGEPTPALRKGH